MTARRPCSEKRIRVTASADTWATAEGNNVPMEGHFVAASRIRKMGNSSNKDHPARESRMPKYGSADSKYAAYRIGSGLPARAGNSATPTSAITGGCPAVAARMMRAGQRRRADVAEAAAGRTAFAMYPETTISPKISSSGEVGASSNTASSPLSANITNATTNKRRRLPGNGK